VRKAMAVLGLLAVAGVGGLAVGCGGSDTEESRTPEGTPTVVNSAPQTDSTGKTVPAPGAGRTTGGETTTEGGEGGGEGGGGAATGDAQAGQTTFNQVCQGCHLQGGQQAGAGPRLAGEGLTAQAIETQIRNGGGGMPANLVQGEDLQNVVAFVVSIQ
jgi:cytochrome c551